MSSAAFASEGSAAGSASGSAAGPASGSAAGSAAGSASGSAAGSMAGSASGSMAGSASGSMAGSASGSMAGSASGSASNTAWRTAPDPIADSDIKNEYTADFVVIGMGHSGTSCARYIVESGGDVIGIEAQDEESFSAFGEDFGHINSKWLANQGVDKVDTLEFFNNWMLNAQNMPNPSLVMKYAQNCGDTFDWWVEGLGDDFMSNVTVDYWPRNDNTISEISGQKFWNGTPQFIVDGYKMTEALKVFHGIITDGGGRIDFSTKAQQLVKDGDKVIGVIATDADGNYVKYTANKAVVLSAGDFGGNLEMCKELCTSITDFVSVDYPWVNMGRDGSGICMGLWAGAHLEPRGIATMGGDTSHPGIVNQGMTSVWFNDEGKRFCNEFFGDTIWTGRQTIHQNLDTVYCLYDGKLMDQLEYNIPAHNRFDPSDPTEIQGLQDILDSAVAAGSAGFATWNGMVYAADTLDEVCDMAAMSADVKATFLSETERYNSLCEAGADSDFGKDPRLLWAIDTAPYYLVVCPAPMIAFFLVTVGGLETDGEMHVLDDDRHPIEGLYAVGNCCGRRFGSSYFSPIAGVSVGFAETLGRELGKEMMAL